MALVSTGTIEIYNEFSLQHELGTFLRDKIGGAKIQFERNVAYFGFDGAKFEKREIDIAIFSPDRQELKIAIELKFPRNGQYPEQMFSFCKDIVFLEQLRASGFDDCLFLVVADDRLFYEGASNGIYSHFRAGAPLTGTIVKPTGRNEKTLDIAGTYEVIWKPITDRSKYAEIYVT